MKSITRHTGILTIIERLTSSINGNPRYLCRVDDYTFRTAPDSVHAYSITNYQDKRVVVTLGTFYGRTTLDTIKSA